MIDRACCGSGSQRSIDPSIASGCGFVAVLSFAFGSSVAAEQGMGKTLARERDDRTRAVVRVADLIDRHFRETWSREVVRPLADASDGTFVRRVHLDLLGRIATVSEAREFLADGEPGKRLRLIMRLVDSPEHARHMTQFWRRVWIPQTEARQFADLAEGLENWLEPHLRAGTPYDELVEALLLAPGVEDGGSEWQRAAVGVPVVLAAASSHSPENLAANVSRAFLGVNLGCARCHDHPYARWSRQQFWEFAAFFSSPERTEAASSGAALPLLPIQDTGRVARPRFLTGERPSWPADAGRDQAVRELARWLVDGDNPYFARNAVNRLWAKLLGRGLIEPRDDLTDANPSPHSRLLEDLAGRFVDGGCDLRTFAAAIVLSRPYNLASSEGDAGDFSDRRRIDDRTWFRAMPRRGLTGAQLYDSLTTAAGVAVWRNDLVSGQAVEERERFVKRFAVHEAIAAERSVDQALTLLNGDLLTRLTSPRTSPLLIALAETPFLDPDDHLDTLFLATLNRFPRPEERRLFRDRMRGKLGRDGVNTGGRGGDALADVLWVLLHSTEFNTLR